MPNEPLRSLDQRLASYQKAGGRGLPRQPDEVSAGRAWTQFAAAAGASLAATSNADAAIQHVVPPAPIRVNVSAGTAVGIDLDNDSIFDVRLGAGQFGNYFSGTFLGTLQGIYGAAVKVGSFFGLYSYGVARYGYGQPISPAFGGYGSILRLSQTVFGNPYGTYGQWGVSDTAYAGFVDTVVGTARAGWIKVRTERSGNHLGAVEVLEWAYESVPGVSIDAGEKPAAMGIPGDYNNNGVVDAADYTIWRDHMGETFQLDNEDPSDTNPGVVDDDDYTFWTSQFGNAGSGTGSQSAAANVPEPSTISLGVLALGAAGVAALRRRSK